MASYNRVTILGNLAAKPELRQTKSGTAVTTIRVATNEVSTDADGARVEKTEWHSVVVFGKTAESCEKYLDKGRTVLVEGKLQTREWEDKDGNKRYSTEILASSVQFVGKGDGGDEKGESAPATAPAGAGKGKAAASTTKGKKAAEEYSDDLPF